MLHLPLDDRLGLHPVDAPVGCPSADQLAAVQAAERRAQELISLSFVSPLWRWFHAPGALRAGLTRFPPEGPPLVWIRDDLSPADVYRVALHELRHVADASIIPLISHEASERRAEEFVIYAMRGDVMEKKCERCGVTLHNRPRFHDSCAPAGNGHRPPPPVARPASGARHLGCGGQLFPYPSTVPGATWQKCFVCGGFVTVRVE
jgi:hypothetical protein